MRINLLTSPRNISTALMYSFAQRQDMEVADEPLYGHYLKGHPERAKEHPGHMEIMDSLETDLDRLIEWHVNGPMAKPHIFYKNMGKFITDMPMEWLLQLENVILIRNPKQLIASYAQVIEQPTMHDVGVGKLHDLYHWLAARSPRPPIVLDSGEVLKSPETVMPKVCEALGLPWDSAMLHWPAGPKPQDGVWAKYWYANVHASTGFARQQTSTRPLPEHCQPVYEASKAYYDELFTHAIKA